MLAAIAWAEFVDSSGESSPGDGAFSVDLSCVGAAALSVAVPTSLLCEGPADRHNKTIANAAIANKTPTAIRSVLRRYIILAPPGEAPQPYVKEHHYFYGKTESEYSYP